MCFCVGVFVFLVWHFIHEQAYRIKQKHKYEINIKNSHNQNIEDMREKNRKERKKTYHEMLLLPNTIQRILPNAMYTVGNWSLFF